jgi:hypothetical protein
MRQKTEQGTFFTRRAFSRFRLVGNSVAIPLVCEIWAPAAHAVRGHGHAADEMLYVLCGASEINGQRVGVNAIAFIGLANETGTRRK